MHTKGKLCTGMAGNHWYLLDSPISVDSENRIASMSNRTNDQANAARLALGWNLLEAGIVELLLSSCDEFMQVNAKHEYEFESNEPRVYRQMHEAIVKARSILSQLPKE